MGPGLRLQPKATPKKVQSKSAVSWKWWTHSETLTLIDVWGNAMADHCKTYKGKRILPSSAYDKIAAQLSETGMRRSVEQIREKIKALKKSYLGTRSKSYDNAGNGKVNSKRQNIIEKMRTVLQANSSVINSEHTWRNDENVEKLNVANSKGKAQRKNKRGKKVFAAHYTEDAELRSIEVLPVNETIGESGSYDTTMGITVQPEHVHGSSEHWAQMNDENQSNQGGGGGDYCTDVGGGEIVYNYTLCQMVESLLNKFLNAQRESEDRYLEMEDQRMKAETERWKAMQRRDAEVINKLLQTQERWREEDKEQEIRIWTALASKVSNLSHEKANNSNIESSSEIGPTLVPLRSPINWEFTGTLRPTSSLDSVPSSSPVIN